MHTSQGEPCEVCGRTVPAGEPLPAFMFVPAGPEDAAACPRFAPDDACDMQVTLAGNGAPPTKADRGVTVHACLPCALLAAMLPERHAAVSRIASVKLRTYRAHAQAEAQRAASFLLVSEGATVRAGDPR